MTEATVVQRGSDEWGMEVVWMDPYDLVPNPANPNAQDDATFNALVESIKTEGWTNPVQAVWMEDLQKFQIVAGEHRWRAAKVLVCKVPVIQLPPEDFDEDRQKWNLVKDNLLHGELNPEKFTRLYAEMVQKYDAEVLQALMGFTSEDSFRKMYKEVKAGLPPELQKALEDAKDEIRTIDDLSTVLNRLFREFGETLPTNMMVFSWGGKDVLWIRCDSQLWKTVTTIARGVKSDETDMTSTMNRLLTAALAADVAVDVPVDEPVEKSPQGAVDKSMKVTVDE